MVLSTGPGERATASTEAGRIGEDGVPQTAGPPRLTSTAKTVHRHGLGTGRQLGHRDRWWHAWVR